MARTPESGEEAVRRRALLIHLENEGECKGMTHLFFPSFEEAKAAEKSAKKVCWGCSVQRECLTYAIEYDEWHGIWGGHGERPRRRIAKKIRAGLMTIEDAL